MKLEIFLTPEISIILHQWCNVKLSFSFFLLMFFYVFFILFQGGRNGN